MQRERTVKATRALRFESDNAQGLPSAGLAHIFVIMMPRTLLQADINAGSPLELIHGHRPLDHPICAVYSRSLETKLKLNSSVEILLAQFRFRDQAGSRRVRVGLRGQ